MTSNTSTGGFPGTVDEDESASAWALCVIDRLVAASAAGTIELHIREARIVISLDPLRPRADDGSTQQDL